MSSVNPYAPPTARVADDTSAADERQPVKLFSAAGRIGRLRFIAYGLLGYLVIYVSGALLFGLTMAIGVPALGFVVIGLGFLAYVVFYTLLAIQRCHDVDWSGWLSILAWIPLLGLMFWFIPGTQGANRYGAPPPPNKGAWLIIIAVVVGAAMIGILAAIAIPQYQDYVNRARAAQTK